MAYYCLGLIALSLLQHSLGGDEILSISPSSFTSALSNDSITFTCTLSQSTSVQVFVVLLGEVGDDPSAFIRVSPELSAERGITIVENLTAIAISIEPRMINNNTAILCTVQEVLGAQSCLANSSFIVQGLLSPPPDLAIESRPQVMRLAWNPPFTLDITNVDPDITGYRVCFTLSAINTCILTEDTMYEYLNISLPLEFLVTALNMAGESNASSVTHQACDTTDSEANRVTISVSFENETFSAVLSLEQPPGTTCYDVYSVNLSTADSTVVHGPLIPVLVGPTVQLLNLQQLQENQIYEAIVTAINVSGERVLIEVFTTFDVQAVDLSEEDQGIRIQCSFVEDSCAQGCQVTVCLKGAGEEVNFGTCRNVTVQRTSVEGSVLPINETGVYVVTSVADIEKDGTVNVVRNITVIDIGAKGTTGGIIASTTVSTPETGENTAREDMAIVGIVVGILAAVLLALLIVVLVIAIIIWKMKRKSKSLKLNGKETTARENDENGPNCLSESITKLMDDSVPGSGGMVTTVGVLPTESMSRHRPTSPLYTDVMQTPTSPPLDQEGVPPEIPPKMSRSSQRNSDIASSEPEPPPPEYRDLIQNAGQEDVHYSPYHRKLIEQHQLGNAVMSQESLTSQNSQASGNVTYAELEHHIKGRRTQHRDKTGVLYSEIKIDPVLPDKRSREGSFGNSPVSVEMDSPQHSSGHSKSTV